MEEEQIHETEETSWLSCQRVPVREEGVEDGTEDAFEAVVAAAAVVVDVVEAGANSPAPASEPLRRQRRTC